MTATYDLIASVTLTTTATTVSFTSIPATYRDLVLVAKPVGFSGGNNQQASTHIRFNADTGNNYNFIDAGGDGTNTFSGVNSNLDYIDTGATVQLNNGVGIIQIMDYSTTNKHKTVLSRGNAFNAVRMVAGRWANNAAINAIEVFTVTVASRSYDTGSTFHLYGIVS